MFLKSLILEVSNKQKKIELELNNKTWKKLIGNNYKQSEIKNKRLN